MVRETGGRYICRFVEITQIDHHRVFHRAFDVFQIQSFELGPIGHQDERIGVFQRILGGVMPIDGLRLILFAQRLRMKVLFNPPIVLPKE